MADHVALLVFERSFRVSMSRETGPMSLSLEPKEMKRKPCAFSFSLPVDSNQLRLFDGDFIRLRTAMRQAE